jgi:hypothetical protein
MSVDPAMQFLNDIINDTKSKLTLDQTIHLAVGTAITTAILSLKEYKGNLNDFRVDPNDLRKISIEMISAGAEDIGLEDLLRIIRTIAKKRVVDQR